MWSPAKLCKSLLIKGFNTLGFIVDIVELQSIVEQRESLVLIMMWFSVLSSQDSHIQTFISRAEETEVALPADDIIIKWLHCTH